MENSIEMSANEQTFEFGINVQKKILHIGNDTFDIEDINETGIEMIISNILCQIGVPAHIKGYEFLRESILLTLNNPKAIYSVTKVLYPTIANNNHSTASRVEKAIHHAIEVAWERGNKDAIIYFLGYAYLSSSRLPSNSEFIAQISDKLRLSLNLK